MDDAVIDKPEMLVFSTPAVLIEEFRSVIRKRVPQARARVDGALWGMDFTERAGAGSPPISALWALRAQRGTLDKLEAMFDADRPYKLTEIVANVRNLFENLVWIRLFNEHSEYGTIFYGQLLKQRSEDLNRTKAKYASEAAMFEQVAVEEAQVMQSFLASMGKDPTDNDLERANAEYERALEALDNRVRRSFAVFARSAQFHTYAWQAQLIRTKHIPFLDEQLSLIQDSTNALETEVADDSLRSRAFGKWNWRNEAQRVGMAEQYDFLYSFTSKLLHASPMNIITEKELGHGEAVMLLDYAVSSCKDILDGIESFDFSGRLNVLAVEWPEEGPEDKSAI